MTYEEVVIDMKVMFHPIIGLKDDGKTYTVRGKGQLFGQDVVWLDGKAGCVALQAISKAKKEEA